MKSLNQQVGWIGFGHMAKAICKKLLEASFLDQSQLFFNQRDMIKAKEHEKEFGIQFLPLQKMVERSKILILAVRPSDLSSLFQEMQNFDLKEKVIISLVAGVSIEKIEKSLSIQSVARAMPNILVELGSGMTALSYSKFLKEESRSFCRLFFGSMGKVVELEEKFLDAVTALSGSSPAYLFALAKEGFDFAKKEGISEKEAKEILSQLFIGVGIAVLEKKESMQELVRKIAVPGGTTEAGLKIFEEKKVGEGFFLTLQSACDKARNLC